MGRKPTAYAGGNNGATYGKAAPAPPAPALAPPPATITVPVPAGSLRRPRPMTSFAKFATIVLSRPEARLCIAALAAVAEPSEETTRLKDRLQSMV